jgi:predicted membrane protein
MKKSVEVHEQMKKYIFRSKIDLAAFAVICIAIGGIFLGRNMGCISDCIFNTLISWQMLLVVIGLYSISHRGYFWGALISGIGLFYLAPIITGAGTEWIRIYWPLIIVFVGLIMLIRMLIPGKKRVSHWDEMSNSYHTENGFVNVENSFSGTKHIVMDEVFTGAKINNQFGGVYIDLRRTSIKEGDTYIDIQCKCGGIELRVPENWLVLTELATNMSGIDDHRIQMSDKINEKFRLILRGKTSLSGIDIKN